MYVNYVINMCYIARIACSLHKYTSLCDTLMKELNVSSGKFPNIEEYELLMEP